MSDGTLSPQACSNLRHIMAFEAKAQPKPLPSSAVTQGFESVAFPKLVSDCSVLDYKLHRDWSGVMFRDAHTIGTFADTRLHVFIGRCASCTTLQSLSSSRKHC